MYVALMHSPWIIGWTPYVLGLIGIIFVLQILDKNIAGGALFNRAMAKVTALVGAIITFVVYVLPSITWNLVGFFILFAIFILGALFTWGLRNQ